MGDKVAAINFLNQAASIQKRAAHSGNQQLQYQLLSSSVIADDTVAPALYELANANRDMGLHAAAVACYRRLVNLPIGEEPGALTLEMKTRAMTNMAHSLYTLGRPKEAMECTMAALDIEPNLSLAWLNLSVSQSLLGDLEGSLRNAKKAFEMDPGNPVVEIGLAFANLFAGDFATGLRHFESRFPYRMPHFLEYPYPRWNGEEGKTIYMVSEQGIGDALSFARFIEMAAARSKFMHIIVQKELVRLLSASLQHVQNIAILGSPQPFLPADCWTTPMSLPTAMGLSTEEIINAPQIKIPNFVGNPQFKNPDAKFHIAVAWSGSPGSDINHWRSFPVEKLLELYRVPGIQLYSIQTNEQAKELHATGCATLIRDLSPLITDIADTIGLLRHVDLVVTTESAPGHIAGHVGLETWIPYSRLGRDWRASADGSQPIWYKKHRFFRQDEDCEWGPVFERITRALAERVANV